MAGCGTQFVRYLFFAVNIIFWILGIVLLAIGIYSRVETDGWQKLTDLNIFFNAANLLIAAGVIVMIIGFLGCCGAWKKWKPLLMVYSALVILIFILEIAGGGYAYNNSDKVQTELTKALKTGVNADFGETSVAAKALTKAMNYFQKKVKCCGATNSTDWLTSKWYTKMNVTTNPPIVPESCCRTVKTGCNVGLNSYDSTKIYSEGCVDKGKQYVKDNLWLIGGVGVGIGVVQLLSLIFAIGLICSFKNEEKGTSA